MGYGTAVSLKPPAILVPGVEVGTRWDRLLDLTKVETGYVIGRKLSLSIDVFTNPLNQGGL